MRPSSIFSPNKHDSECIRIRQHGFYVIDLRSVVELETYIPLSELEDALIGSDVQLDVLVPGILADI